MRHQPIHHTLSVLQDTWARVYVNELPLYKRPFKGPDSVGASINELLVPGENEITIELLGTIATPPGEYDKDAIRYRLFEVLKFEPVAVREILDLRFPEIFLEAEEPFQRFPYHYRKAFDPGVPIIAPPWQNAPHADFACDGTKELREAVTRVHSAMVDGDADRFLAEVALKLSHGAQAFAGDPDQTVAAKETMIRDFFVEPLSVQPLDFSDLHFHALQGGRVAHVARYDDSPALYAEHRDNPNIGMSTDLLMTQHNGHWMAFA